MSIEMESGAAAPAMHAVRVGITAVVYSLNEAELLPACLERLGDFDEIVVCDMQSEDDTVAVAESFGARVVPVPRVPIVEQVRQFALDAAATNWVLLVDADEHLPEGFYELLADLVTGRPELAAVRLRYDNLAFGSHVPNALRGSAKYSLLRVAATHFSGSSHPHIPPRFDAPVADAPASVPAILHHNFRTVEQSLEKVLRYARNIPGEAALLDDPVAIPRLFLRDLVFSGVWRDGRAGLTLVTLNLIGRVYSAALAWEKAGYPDSGWNPRALRTARLLESTQRRLVRARDAIVKRARR